MPIPNRSFAQNVEPAPEDIPGAVSSTSSDRRHSPISAQGSSAPNAADGDRLSVRPRGHDDKISKERAHLDLRKS